MLFTGNEDQFIFAIKHRLQFLDVNIPGQEVIKLQKRLLNVWDEVQLSVATRTSIASFSEAYELGIPAPYMQKFLNRKR